MSRTTRSTFPVVMDAEYPIAELAAQEAVLKRARPDLAYTDERLAMNRVPSLVRDDRGA